MNIIKKRFLAYLIDSIFITIILTLIYQITFINPYYDEYIEYSKKHLENQNINDILEYTNSDEFDENLYALANYGKVYFIVDSVVIIGYFVFFQKFNNGQTLGKKLMKIKIANIDNKELSIKLMFIRSVFIYEILANLLRFIYIFTSPSVVSYSLGDSIVLNLFSIIFWICLFMVLFTKDHRGLHEKISKTKVIDA